MPSFPPVCVVAQLSLARARSDAWRYARKRKGGHAKAREARLPRRIMEVLIDRVEAAIEAGRIELVDHPADVQLAEGPAIHTDAYAEILAVLFEEEYEALPRDEPTDAAPRSAERTDVYVRRAKEGRPVDHPLDSSTRDGRRTLAGTLNSNGNGFTVTGWQEEQGAFDAEDDREPEEFRLSARDLAELSRRRGKRR